MSVQCFPNGSLTQQWDCDECIPDDGFDTIERFGWGWGWTVDHGAASGRGPFLMCPGHRTYDNDGEQPEAVRRNAEAKALAALVAAEPASGRPLGAVAADGSEGPGMHNLPSKGLK